MGLSRAFLSSKERKDCKRLRRLLPKNHGYKIKNKPFGLVLEHNSKLITMACYHDKVVVNLFRKLKSIRPFYTVKVVNDNEVSGVIERHFEAV